jgi:hypothetical protein
LSKQDYTLILTLVQENFSEKVPETEVLSEIENTELKKLDSKVVPVKSFQTETHKIDLDNETQALKLQFKVVSIKGHFYIEESLMVERKTIREAKNAFSIMELSKLKLAFSRGGA